MRGQCFPLQLNLSAEIELYPEIETIIDILNSTYGAACTNGREEGGLQGDRRHCALVFESCNLGRGWRSVECWQAVCSL